MFDIGVSELFVIGVVALIVIGPERLPRVAKTVGLLFGRMQRYVTDVKADINREIELDELRKLKSTMQDAARSFEESVSTQVNFIESEVKQAGAELEKQAQEAVAPMTGIQLMPPPTQAAQFESAGTGESAAVHEAPETQMELGLDNEPPIESKHA
ncbi:MAG TPA: Sec-independent protein translocase protein TatB [Burkholderiales bacterium]